MSAEDVVAIATRLQGPGCPSGSTAAGVSTRSSPRMRCVGRRRRPSSQTRSAGSTSCARWSAARLRAWSSAVTPPASSRLRSRSPP